jgi:hypothetical protein
MLRLKTCDLVKSCLSQMISTVANKPWGKRNAVDELGLAFKVPWTSGDFGLVLVALRRAPSDRFGLVGSSEYIGISSFLLWVFLRIYL